MFDNDEVSKLHSSGIIDAYEYILGRLLYTHLPTGNIYEKCLYFLLEYQNKIKRKNISLEDMDKISQSTNFNDLILHSDSQKEIIPDFPILLKSKILYQKETSTNIKNKQIFQMSIEDMIKNKIQLVSKRVIKNYNNNSSQYGNYKEYFKEENRKLLQNIYKTFPKYNEYEFIPLLEIRKMNKDNKEKEINELNNRISISNLSDQKVKEVSKEFIDQFIFE